MSEKKTKNTKSKKKEPTLDAIHKSIKKNIESIKVVSTKGSKSRK